jgi:hypothetical protein
MTDHPNPRCSECGEPLEIGYAESYGHDPACSQASLEDQKTRLENAPPLIEMFY